MPHEVIMPALGMTQDTGKLVRWLKNEGDPVKSGDILYEVETDKSTMEVDAQADGYLTGVSAAVGDDVPVGNIIALISDAPVAAAVLKSSVPAREEEPQEAPAPLQTSHPDIAPRSVAASLAPKPPVEGKILASPKAKRLASEMQLDLADLANAGHPQPYHVADIEVLKSLPVQGESTATAMDNQPALSLRFIALEARTKGVKKFLEWMQSDGDITLELKHVWASYAAACLRKSMNVGDAHLALKVIHLNNESEHYLNPDKQRLSRMVAYEDTGTPDLVVKDITESQITQMRLGTNAAPVLTIAKAKKKYLLSLEFTSQQLTDDQAIAFMMDFCERLNDPLKHVL